MASGDQKDWSELFFLVLPQLKIYVLKRGMKLRWIQQSFWLQWNLDFNEVLDITNDVPAKVTVKGME